MSDRSETLAEAFGEHTDADTAATAADHVDSFADQYDEDLTSEAVVDRFEDAPYDEFRRAFNWLVGDLAADTDDCTDSREFRIGGPGDHAADPTITGWMVAGGTYTLVLERASGGPIEVGALGDFDFQRGWYAYTGSAQGSGGFSRVDRHRAVAAGDNDARHWHVDYLLGDEATGVETVVTTAADIECGVARQLVDAVGGGVPDFGCSDCRCGSHLVGCDDRVELVAAVERAHDAAADTR